MKGSIKRYCTCAGPNGKMLGAKCPALTNDRHGEFNYRERIPSKTGLRELRRRGFHTRKAAGAFRDHVHDLLKMAKDDARTLARVGDLIFEKSNRGGQLPEADVVRRRLGLGGALEQSLLTSEYLEEWHVTKKRAKKASTVRGYRQHLDHYLIPQLGEIPLERLTALQITDLFDLIDEWNSEIIAAKAEGRSPVLEGDQRKRPGLVGVATQRRVYATLRNALNAAMKRKTGRLIDYNPCDGVEMPAEYRDPARTWDPEQVGEFLASCEDDPLHYLYRLILIHGPRRGEAVGSRWAGHNHKAKSLRVLRPLLQMGGQLFESTPKSQAGIRVLFLDDETNEGIEALHEQQSDNRRRLGPAYQDNDLIWCREDGSPYPPDYVSRHFRELAAAARLPVIKLHEGRHTAATLRLEAGVDVKIVSEQLGHSKVAITQDLYQHVRRAVLDQATETVIALLPPRPRKSPSAE